MEKKLIEIKKIWFKLKNRIFLFYFFLNHDLYQPWMVLACAAKRRWWLGEEMHGVWSRGSKTKRKTKEDPDRDCQRARKLNNEDATDGSKWRKLIKDVRCFRIGVSWWVFLLVPAYSGSTGPKAIKRLCVCVCCVFDTADMGFSWWWMEVHCKLESKCQPFIMLL